MAYSVFIHKHTGLRNGKRLQSLNVNVWYIRTEMNEAGCTFLKCLFICYHSFTAVIYILFYTCISKVYCLLSYTDVLQRSSKMTAVMHLYNVTGNERYHNVCI